MHKPHMFACTFVIDQYFDSYPKTLPLFAFSGPQNTLTLFWWMNRIGVENVYVLCLCDMNTGEQVQVGILAMFSIIAIVATILG